MARKQAKHGQGGFTLVELLVAMLIVSIVIAAIYKTFNVQRQSYYVQDQVAAMQQNLRAALVMMQSDIWMAGYDQDSDGNANCGGILTAGEGQLEINMDLNGSGGCPSSATTPAFNALNKKEWVAFGISGYPNGVVTGGGVADLGRDVNASGLQDIAVGVQAVGFAYAFDANRDGQLDTTAAGNHVIWALDTDGDGNWDNLDMNDDGQITASDAVGVTAIPGSPTGVLADLAAIRAVRVWILVRSDSADKNFNNTSTYMVGRNKVSVNDGFRRRLMDTIIECRNMRK